MPIIVEKYSRSQLESIPEKKFLLKEDLCMYHFTLLLRSKIRLNKADALFLFVNGYDILKCDTLIKEVYNTYKDPDGFLYFKYHDKGSFGA